jgi:hypothetical protein
MHVGELNPDGSHKTKSKTQAMYFPARDLSPEELETAQADITFGQNNEFYVPFTSMFTYLGCRITQDLKDETEIEHRLKEAKAQIAALTNYFRSNADLTVKRITLLAIPINTALYGCESWTLNYALERSLTSFYHTAIRKLLNINIHHVENYRIRNEHLRVHLSLPCIIDIIRQRQFNFIGKIARLPHQHLYRRFMTAWIHNPRRSGGQQKTLRNTYLDTLQNVLPDDVDRSGTVGSWTHLAQQKSYWKQLGTEWIARQHAIQIFENGHHPMLGVGLNPHKYDRQLTDIQRQRNLSDQSTETGQNEPNVRAGSIEK